MNQSYRNKLSNTHKQVLLPLFQSLAFISCPAYRNAQKNNPLYLPIRCNNNYCNQLLIHSIMQATIEQAPQPRKKLNIIIISDTHGCYKQLDKIMKMSGDIFIHAGDFTEYGRQKDFLTFFKYLEKLNFRYKIVIAGNHEIVLDNGCIPPKKREQYLTKYPCSLSREAIIGELKKRCIYLQHQEVEIEGVRIFGSPYSPWFVGNAFQYPLHREKVIWDHIPQGIDLLVTHSPPKDILDLNGSKIHAGSTYLREVVLQRKPKYHVFGHIHQSAGMFKVDGVTFLNVANEPSRLLI